MRFDLQLNCISWQRITVSVIGILAISAVSVTQVQAELLAYEPFDYTPGSLVGLNGGTGFDGAWDEVQGDNLSTDVEADSLQYIDGGGNVLVTAGGKMNNSGETGTSTPGRTFSFRRDGAALGATENAPVFTYFSFLGIRQGDLNTPNGGAEDGTYGRGANISLFDNSCIDCMANGAFERFNFGENSGHQFPVTNGADFLRIQRDDPSMIPDWQEAYGKSSALAQQNYDFWQFGAPQVDISVDALSPPNYVDPEDGEILANVDWQENPLNGRFSSRFSRTPFAGQTSLMVARIEHYGASGDGSQYGIEKPDRILIWMNPDLSAEPSDSEADVVIDFAQIEARAQEINDGGLDTAMPYRNINDSNVYSFDRIRFFAGNASGDRAFADWLIDELRVGTTYADVTPHTAPAAATGVPEPTSVLLAAMGLALGALSRRRG